MKIKGVGSNAIKQVNQRRESGQWLHDAPKLNLGYYMASEYQERVDTLFDSIIDRPINMPDKWRKDFEILLANLFVEQGKRPIRISLNYNTYNKSQLSYTRIKTLIELLEKNKLIESKIGFMNPKERRQTRIYPTEILMQMFREGHHAVRYKPLKVVELWKSEKKKVGRKTVTEKTEIQYKPTGFTRRITKILEKLNEINNEANICITHNSRQTRLNVAVCAKFTNKFTLGGRLYASGRRYFQGLSSEDREEITFNGKETVEVDFKAIHPMLLYAGEGIQYRKDPYSVIDPRPEIRPFLKIILLCMVNADNFTDAQKAANDWLVNKKDRKDIKTGLLIKKQILRLGVTKAGPFMERFLSVHEPIAKYFCTGRDTGLKLTNADGMLALDVVNHFVRQNIPILCIHDSFIVERSRVDELKKVMRETYKKHTGFRIKIK